MKRTISIILIILVILIFGSIESIAYENDYTLSKNFIINDVYKNLNYFCVNHGIPAIDFTVGLKDRYQIDWKNGGVVTVTRYWENESKPSPDNLNEKLEHFGFSFNDFKSQGTSNNVQSAMQSKIPNKMGVYAISYALSQRGTFTAKEGTTYRSKMGNSAEQIAIWLIMGAGNGFTFDDSGNVTSGKIGAYEYDAYYANIGIQLCEESQAYGQYCLGRVTNDNSFNTDNVTITDEGDYYKIGPVTYDYILGYSSYGGDKYIKTYAPTINDVKVGTSSTNLSFAVSENNEELSLEEFNNKLLEITDKTNWVVTGMLENSYINENGNEIKYVTKPRNEVKNFNNFKNWNYLGYEQKEIEFYIKVNKDYLKYGTNKFNIECNDVLDATMTIVDDGVDTQEYGQAFLMGTTTPVYKTYEFNVNTIPEISIQLEKYNSYDKANKNLNATFKIEANQDGENIYTKEIEVVNGKMCYKESREKIETIQINPVNKNDVYVKITEIETPTGYNTIEPICIKYTLRENNRMWDLNIINQADDWNEESGFEGEYSNWELHDKLEDKTTDLPNAYKSPNNDKIIVKQDGEDNKIHIFKIYNEPKVDITLIKKDPNEIIEGVRFTGIIENVESFDGSIKNSQGVIPFDLKTDANGEIKFSFKNIVFKNGENTIIIKITGEEVPYDVNTNWYYEKLNVSEDNPVTITLTFNDYKELESVTVDRQKDKITATKDQTNTITLNVENPKTVIPNIELNLQKYNSYYATTKKLLSATFKIEAVQNGKTIYSEEKTISDETITITPQNKYDIYVKITETKAPAGYSTIDPICIQYHLRDSYYKWDMKMIDIKNWPSNKLNYKEWTLFDKLEDGNENLPNAYATTYKYKNEEKENSIVIVDEEGKGHIFEVYNEPKVEIKLAKIDNTSKEALANVEFKGTIENIKYFKEINNTNVYTINKDNTIGFKLKTDKNGILTLKFEDIELLNQNNGKGTITINIEEVEAPASGTNDWYYKKLEKPITIYLTFDINEGIIDTKYIKWQKSGNEENITLGLTSEKIIAITVPNIRAIDVSGLVWVDGETNINIKTQGPANGIMDGKEEGKKDVIVELYNEDSKKTEATTYTDADGIYNFKNVKYGVNYIVKFTYDGINYEDTIFGQDSKAQEDEGDRNNFNAKFNTITNNKATSADGTGEIKLNYDIDTSDDIVKSMLITLDDNNLPQEDFKMSAQTKTINETKHVKNLDFGLQTRGTDLALETGVNDVTATINGQEVDYKYSDGKIIIENTTTTSKTEEKMYLYNSDYTFRIEDYKEVEGKDDDYKEIEGSLKEESELEVKVKYYLKIANQAYDDVSQIIVDYDYNPEILEICEIGNLDVPEGCSVDYTGSQGRVTITCNNLAAGNSAYIYLEFTVNKDENGIMLGDIENKAEIISYTTKQGYIDIDSQPGNCSKEQHEDDCATSKLTIAIKEDPDPEDPTNPKDTTRKISGYVWDDSSSNKSKVNDVIVQLIELKDIGGKTYEYIWQETVSGTGTGKRFKNTGTEQLETYKYKVEKGKYEFEGFIPGDYIVRFVYGDGTTYDMTENVIKYNGQDYKSTTDLNYQAEWYNNSSYSDNDNDNASVARDNEARRLETMAYSVNVDAEKGILLKLLDTQDVRKLNEVEKKLVIAIYNRKYPDDEISDIDENSDIDKISDINEKLTKLLKEETLENTWMCAETSKIKVPVDAENLEGTEAKTTVLPNNITEIEFSNVNFGLKERPQTKIELKKYITGFKLTASNGQTLANAVLDVEEYYYDNPDSIGTKIQGIRDNLVINDTFWSYEVSPTELSTVVEGANLEFVYELVVENHSDTDYLSETLIKAYNGDETVLKDLSYESYLGLIAREQEPNGTYLGEAYYTGEIGKDEGEVQTEVTSLKDYVNDNLRLIGVNLTEDEYEEATEKHYVLNDAYGLDQKEVKTLILKGTSEKLTSEGKTSMSKVTLGKDAISTSGTLEVDTYIAEVMAYTNAAGRRANTTPANAEFVSKGIDKNTERTHEKDEADTARVQIGSATGEDEKTPYVWLIAITAGIAIIGIGTIVTKKYIIK